jgi:hypothetical protein
MMLSVIVGVAYRIFGYTLQTLLVLLLLWQYLLSIAVFIAVCWLLCYFIGWLYEQHLEGKLPHRFNRKRQTTDVSAE